MARNVEIKARLAPEELGRVREAALARSRGAPAVLRQTDTFYRVPSGRLKLRCFEDGTGELIAYDRPDRAGPRLSSYVVSRCLEPRSLHEALERALGVRGVVDKRREVIQIGPTRVHLDQVRGLGCFLELEVVLGPGQGVEDGEAVAAELMEAFQIRRQALVAGAYIDLLEAETTP